jgi:methyl-accepting chemotaxis protein
MSVVIVNLAIVGVVRKPISVVSERMEQVSQGNYHQEAVVFSNYGKELVALQNSYLRMIDNMQVMLKTIQTTSLQYTEKYTNGIRG